MSTTSLHGYCIQSGSDLPNKKQILLAEEDCDCLNSGCLDFHVERKRKNLILDKAYFAGIAGSYDEKYNDG
jgi:hypothetical protein